MLGKNKDYHKDTCENCKYKFNCYGLVGGQAICNRCYDLWFEHEKLKKEKFNYNVFLEEKNNMIIMIHELKEENEKLKSYIKALN